MKDIAIYLKEEKDKEDLIKAFSQLELDFSYVCISSSQQLLSELKKNKESLVFMDIDMLEMSNFLLEASINKVSPDTRVIYLVPVKDYAYLSVALARSGINYILKPYSLISLEMCLSKVFDRKGVSIHRGQFENDMASQNLFHLLRNGSGKISFSKAMIMMAEVKSEEYRHIFIEKFLALDGAFSYEDKDNVVFLFADFTSSDIKNVYVNLDEEVRKASVLAFSPIFEKESQCQSAAFIAYSNLSQNPFSKKREEEPGTLEEEIGLYMRQKKSILSSLDTVFSFLSFISSSFLFTKLIILNVLSSLNLSLPLRKIQCSDSFPALYDASFECARMAKEHEKREKCGARAISGNLKTEVEQYIEQNYDREISLDEIAQKMGYSTTYFSKLFARTFGISFSQYLVEYRIKKASELLLSSNMPVSAVARSTGFYDSSYFVNTFKKIKGLTPRKFRSEGVLA
ncbi:MAG TPA: DNA-binding response regulator [Candidatus Ornithospirochaeta avicola]|uniref:DNA-binding response regulator n=1 Tax=Candidatus Ornithospirochaeta avicola TaxID=2840896 RepID=A0A9D1TND4_9SPIO|nr:DNA-binding response regulator [Candidatus Ornithospirochaeta avicola]